MNNIKTITVDWLEKNLDEAIDNNFIVDGFRFERGCLFYPEEYEIFDDMGVVGYTRLRSGMFRVIYPYIEGKDILCLETGEEHQGTFNDNRERAEYIYKAIEAIKLEDSENRKSKNKEEYKEFRKHFNKIQFHLSRPSSFATNRISKDQVEKLNNLIGALICHGKDHLDYDYVEDDLIEYFIEAFLYSIDNNYRSYLEVKPLYKCEGKTPNGPMLYVKTENEYKSDFEVKIVEKDKKDKCIKCACSNCQACHDNYCPGENHFGKETNCDHCIYESKVVKKGDKIELTKMDEITMNRKDCFKEKCDGKFEAVKSWCIECSSFDMITPLVDEWREERKKINFRRAIKAWREVYHYVDSFYLEDTEDTLKEPIYPFRYWNWIRNVGNAIEYGLWGIIDYFNIYKPHDKEWYWYKRMQTHLPMRQEGDIMPHQHFNEYIYYINQCLNKNEIDKKEVLKNILDRIREESDIISHWGQNGAFSAIAPGDMKDLSTMPCDKDYYIKIENLCKDFMEYIKDLMNLKDEHDVMDFIGYSAKSLGYGLQIETKRLT